MEIHSVPGHMGISENKKEDEVAKEAAEKPGTRQYMERFTSLAHVGYTIMEPKWKEAKYWFKPRCNRQGSLQRQVRLITGDPGPRRGGDRYYSTGIPQILPAEVRTRCHRSLLMPHRKR